MEHTWQKNGCLTGLWNVVQSRLQAHWLTPATGGGRHGLGESLGTSTSTWEHLVWMDRQCTTYIPLTSQFTPAFKRSSCLLWNCPTTYCKGHLTLTSFYEVDQPNSCTIEWLVFLSFHSMQAWQLPYYYIAPLFRHGDPDCNLSFSL